MLRNYHTRLRAVLRAEPPFSPKARDMDAVWGCMDPVWGRFALSRRLNMDQTGVFLYKPFGTGKTYAMPDEKVKGGFKNTHVRGGRPMRMATHIGCLCADPDVEPPRPALVFKGQGLRLSREAKTALQEASDGFKVHYTFQKKAWCDTTVMRWYFLTVIQPWVHRQLSADEKETPWKKVLLIFDHSGKTHNSMPVRKAIHEAGCVPFYGEANGTHRWQPFDSGVGVWGQKRFDNKLRRWLSVKANRQAYGSRKLTMQDQRLLALRWVGESCDELQSESRRHLRETAWSHTGSSLTADGSGDHLVQPEGLVSYAVPDVGAPAEYADFRDMPYNSDAEESDGASGSDDDDGPSSASSSVVGDSSSESDEESSADVAGDASHASDASDGDP